MGCEGDCGVTGYPWESEPDEVAWRHDGSGYLCLLIRGPTGAWCGYVGVDTDHIAHGLRYYADSYSVEDIARGDKSASEANVQIRVNEIQAHGGLTFSGERSHPEASGFEHWFGFDCAHAGDFSPKYDDPNHPVLGLGKPTGWGGVIEYRDVDYAKSECEKIASQLKEIADTAH